MCSLKVHLHQFFFLKLGSRKPQQENFEIWKIIAATTFLKMSKPGKSQ